MNTNCRVFSRHLGARANFLLLNLLRGKGQSFYGRVSLCERCFHQTRRQLHYSRQPATRLLLIPGKFGNLAQLQRLFGTKLSNSLKAPPVRVSRRNPSRSEMRRLISLATSEKWNLTGAVLLLLFSSAVTMAVPFALGKVIDLIYTSEPEKMKQNLDRLTITLFFIFLLGGACNFGRVYLMNISAQRITKALREKVFSAIMRQEVAFFDYNKTGELVNRLSADTSLVSHCVTMNISDGLRSFIMVISGISMMFYMSAELALVSLCIVPPVAAMAIIYGRFIRRMTTKVQDALAEATQVAEERISNIRTVKAFSKEDKEIEKYENRMSHILQLATRESLARGTFFGMSGLSGNAIVLAVLYYGGVMVSGNTMSMGDLSAFLMYAAYIGVSMGGLTSFYSELNRGLGASVRLWDLIERVPQIPVTGGIEPSWEPMGGVEYEGVVFAYPNRNKTPVLTGLNLKIPSSTVTAVVGSSGSGKSTLAALLLRLYDPQGGIIKLDGTPVHMYDPVWLRSHIGTVSQEPVLFSGTIRDNILYGAINPKSITEDRLFEVLKEANAFDFVMTLQDGLETLVGERGIMLSGGQKQRIAIARALIKNPKILLLDEATSALDAESEHLVQAALEKIMKGRTVLTIAHRLSTIKSADQIAVLDKGQIVELGSYNQLMNIKDGVFRKLVKHQTFQQDS